MSYTEETQAAGERLAGRLAPHRWLFTHFASSTLFLLSSLPLGILWFVVLTGLLSVGLALTIVWVGLPILVLAMLVCTLGAVVERWRLAALLGASLPSPYCPLPRSSVLARLRVRATDLAFWRALLYLFLLFPVGLAEFFVVLALALSAAMATYPLWFWSLPAGQGIQWPGFAADTLPEALLVMLVGLVIGTAAAASVLGAAWAHAGLGRALLGPSGRERLEERVEVLTESRSRAMDTEIAERRRIERDLHDGAQQRLVSLAMDLGMAKEKMAEDPEAARELVEEAHGEAKLALSEIRNLVRGIHPAILTDRGFDAALSALSERSPVPVEVDVGLEARLPEAVETTAYFVVAEALSNVAKHSSASAASVVVWHERTPEERLVVQVTDDGGGGATPNANGGLSGLADRLSALDGRLLVQSPEGGPTLVRAEIPLGVPEEEAPGGP
jgi:signal transduction histidine kinase